MSKGPWRRLKEIMQTPYVCWECEHCTEHSDGAKFCGPFAARRAEGDKPLANCTIGKVRDGKMRKCLTTHHKVNDNEGHTGPSCQEARVL